MLTDLDHVWHWLQTAKLGETLIFCPGGDPDIISRRNPHFGEVYRALLEARDKRRVLLDTNPMGQAFAMKLSKTVDANDLSTLKPNEPAPAETQWTMEDAKATPAFREHARKKGWLSNGGRID